MNFNAYRHVRLIFKHMLIYKFITTNKYLRKEN